MQMSCVRNLLYTFSSKHSHKIVKLKPPKNQNFQSVIRKTRSHLQKVFLTPEFGMWCWIDTASNHHKPPRDIIKLRRLQFAARQWHVPESLRLWTPPAILRPSWDTFLFVRFRILKAGIWLALGRSRAQQGNRVVHSFGLLEHVFNSIVF